MRYPNNKPAKFGAPKVSLSVIYSCLGLTIGLKMRANRHRLPAPTHGGTSPDDEIEAAASQALEEPVEQALRNIASENSTLPIDDWLDLLKGAGVEVIGHLTCWNQLRRLGLPMSMIRELRFYKEGKIWLAMKAAEVRIVSRDEHYAKV
jgi:hypothetical protein